MSDVSNFNMNDLIEQSIKQIQDEISKMELQDYINSCSDNFYYTSGRKKVISTKIKQLKEEIECLKDMGTRYR